MSFGTPADTRAFVARRFGTAPIAVYLDPSRAASRTFGVASYPEFRFVNARGALTKRAPTGFPFG